MLAKGTILKNWVLGDKLGSGACSDVYVVTPKENSAETYAMKLSPIPPPSKKKTHAARSADALYAEHLLYVNTLQGLEGIPALPATGAYGEDKGYRFLVLERLGRTLEQVKTTHGGKLPEGTVSRLGLNILSILRQLHARKLLFVDVKPDNFMLSRGREDQVYCVDFGIAERYLLVTGAHKPHKMGPVVGTPTFSSVHCHLGNTPARRDDIEAMLYVCLYLIRGDLPWQAATSDAAGAQLKYKCDPDELCAGLAVGWKTMLRRIQECAFDQEPDYAYFETTLKQIARSTPLHGPYQWGEEVAVKPTKRSGTTSTNATRRSKPSKKAAEQESPLPNGAVHETASEVSKTGGTKRKQPSSNRASRAPAKRTPASQEIDDGGAMPSLSKTKEKKSSIKKAPVRATVTPSGAAATPAPTSGRHTRSTARTKLQ
ncbi:CK1/CK1 protein kinase [Aphanomyces invadans]|uniref:Casein kinase I n=1 Tax=Aphanomyces invadans TaxID=157072 RepID=A0A024UQ62_9STRA|nr:CK1/CK1 protein kinase [Aphanomyces invadans]ETW07962.1 CK1/CK1 protein kinase [Aphanomyces invadans]|eukprot:XP_008864055.1 CK1/CK1 protein kinase [Aphanomyces invadans]